ncbi:MAG: GGDEF domain-containing protein, partial [Ruminococcus sp.]|nr:GGDEF domain-containing protein [Ruminococcus sp.]
MRQFQFAYQDQDQLRAELIKIRQWCTSSVYSHIVFQIMTETLDQELLDSVCAEIIRQLPEADFFGCSSNGNIIGGEFSEPDIGIVCTVFEYPSTKMEFMQYTLTAETVNEVIADVINEIEKRPWVTAVELVTTIRGMSMTSFCEGLQKARADIQIFGGGAFSFDLYDNRACIFSKKAGISENGVVFWLLGGEDFHVTSTFITGWKPLGKTFHVTMSDGNILYELDNMPAYEVYSKYLGIRNNEHFFYNSLEFPFFYHHNGIDILRAP